MNKNYPNNENEMDGELAECRSQKLVISGTGESWRPMIIGICQSPTLGPVSISSMKGKMPPKQFH